MSSSMHDDDDGNANVDVEDDDGADDEVKAGNKAQTGGLTKQ